MTPRKILVTGGAGYIGSHTVRMLLRQGHDVTVVDNLSKGHRHNVPAGRLHEVELADTPALAALLREKQCEAVIHFAAFIAVGESMREPAMYFKNNTCGSLSLLDAMTQAGVKHIVFSSTAAVYGDVKETPILEEFPIGAVNPYGESKVMVETLLGWFDRIHGLTSVCLRYFNASGCDPEGGLGEEHEPETHLIPLVFRAVQTGKPITVFGDDYATPDGTCIRDYIHVNDLAQAHILAVDYLVNGGHKPKVQRGHGNRAQRIGTDSRGGRSHWEKGAVHHGPAPRGRPAEPGGEQPEAARAIRMGAAIRGIEDDCRARLEFCESGTRIRLIAIEASEAPGF